MSQTATKSSGAHVHMYMYMCMYMYMYPSLLHCVSRVLSVRTYAIPFVCGAPPSGFVASHTHGSIECVHCALFGHARTVNSVGELRTQPSVHAHCAVEGLKPVGVWAQPESGSRV